ncbi:MAG TPA: hypothetical protein VFK58_03075 [Sphingomicrobium sp.]|nr:hypothetical protein [Sphingomicrobium sp.]
MRKSILAMLGAITVVSSVPAMAQDSAVKPGPLWNVSRIDVLDGKFEDYMDFLTKTWADNQAFAKSQGWILDYHILDNINARDGEPDIILITRFADYVPVAELERRNAIMNKRMNQTDRTADQASGARGVMRKLMGNVMYRELVKR